MDQRTVFFIVFFVLAIIVMGTAAFSKLPSLLRLFLVIVALLLDVIAFASRYYTYMMLQLVTQRKKEIVLDGNNPYFTSSGEDAIIHIDKGGDVTATMYISIPVYRSGTEMSNSEKLEFARQVSRIISYSTDPVRFTTELYVMNKDEYIKKIKDAIAEFESGMFVEQEKESSKVAGRLDMLRNMLEHVSEANSMELVTFASMSATGVKEEDAVAQVQQKAKELISGITSTFGVPASIITGKELLKFIEPEFLIPYSTTEEKIRQAMKAEVI